MMQKVLFLGHSKGQSKKGNPYDICNVSDGLQAFPPFNVDPKVSDKLDGLEMGQDLWISVELSVYFGTLRGTIVEVSAERPKKG